MVIFVSKPVAPIVKLTVLAVCVTERLAIVRVDAKKESSEKPAMIIAQ